MSMLASGEMLTQPSQLGFTGAAISSQHCHLELVPCCALAHDLGACVKDVMAEVFTCPLRAEKIQAAAKILGVESYHAGIVRARLELAEKETPLTEVYGGSVAEMVGKISVLRNQAGGKNNDDQGIVKGNLHSVASSAMIAMADVCSVQQHIHRLV